MKNLILIILIIIITLTYCSQKKSDGNKKLNKSEETIDSKVIKIINEKGKYVKTRFNPPKGYVRIKADSNSFGYYLRNLELKPFGSKVLYYNAYEKLSDNVYISVVKMDIGKKDLQQCADAVMRLRAEYLYQRKEYEKILFNFVSDGKPRYYEKYAEGDYSYKKFLKYMDFIFAYANTSSLYDELEAVREIENIRIGDVLIQKGKPYGHAVILVDVAINKNTGKKIFLLAQSYMPAQEIQILINPINNELSPWYEFKKNTDVIYTPEWNFNKEDLRRFVN
ncbi:MAG: DUF4846 domain-containing protein [Bacteroidales bacterium]|nr:DUF4846 domain-containing protein [Bacteroidales bacterium]